MHAVETFSEGGFTVSIYPDDCGATSREWDNLGTMVCWHRRYKLGDRQVKPNDFESMDEMVASFGARIVLPLYLYDHGGITMRTVPFGDLWDSGQVGFIYVTDETLREEYSAPPSQDIPPETLSLARQVLVGEVETYDQDLTGDVYGYVIQDSAGEHVGSCRGFYGLKCAREEAQAALALASNGKRTAD